VGSTSGWVDGEPNLGHSTERGSSTAMVHGGEEGTPVRGANTRSLAVRCGGGGPVEIVEACGGVGSAGGS
jgi:hypothetical protein